MTEQRQQEPTPEQKAAAAIATELYNNWKPVACHISPANIGPLTEALARCALEAARG